MKRPFLAARTRIALLSAGISGAALIVCGSILWFWLHQERLDALDREIRALAYRHPGWLNNRANYERVANAIEFVFGDERKEQLILLATDATGGIRYRSPHWPAAIDPASIDLRLDDAGDNGDAAGAPFPAPPRGAGRWGRGLGPGRAAGSAASESLNPPLFTKTPRFFTVKTPAGSWRLGVLGNAEDRLVLGIDRTEALADLRRLRLLLLLALPVALIPIGLGGWLVAGRAMRPLQLITRTAEQVTARGLDQRIPAAADDPVIHQLIVVLNGMMDRLEQSFRQATRFSADASHELKTPLAVMQAELEQALQRSPPGSPDQAAYASLLAETERLKNITRSLLLLSRADSGQLPLAPESLDLAAELATLVTDAVILAEAADVTLETQLAAVPPVSADRSLLLRAISNLVENAIQYNRPGGRVALHLAPATEGVRIEVLNTGAGIPPEDQPRVFERFHRGAGARDRRADGVGLGLSLAREIIHAHGGRLELAESRPDHTLFRLTLPLAPPSS